MEKMRAGVIKISDSVVVNLVMVMLAILSVSLLVYELSADLPKETVRFIHITDLTIALIFLSDFFIGLAAHKNRLLYFKNNWIDLLSSIPVTDGLYRSFRIFRLLRLVRVIRLIQLRKIKKTYDLAGESSKYIYLFSITTAVILSTAVSFFTLEIDQNPNINNFYDAIWWAVGAGTVGYGEIYPVTWEGRLIGIFLMFFGIGLVGTVAGFVGGHVLKLKK